MSSEEVERHRRNFVSRVAIAGVGTLLVGYLFSSLIGAALAYRSLDALNYPGQFFVPFRTQWRSVLHGFNASSSVLGLLAVNVALVIAGTFSQRRERDSLETARSSALDEVIVWSSVAVALVCALGLFGLPSILEFLILLIVLLLSLAVAFLHERSGWHDRRSVEKSDRYRKKLGERAWETWGEAQGAGIPLTLLPSGKVPGIWRTIPRSISLASIAIGCAAAAILCWIFPVAIIGIPASGWSLLSLIVMYPFWVVCCCVCWYLVRRVRRPLDSIILAYGILLWALIGWALVILNTAGRVVGFSETWALVVLITGVILLVAPLVFLRVGRRSRSDIRCRLAQIERDLFQARNPLSHGGRK